ncbi:MAG: ABC transporter permease [Actinomycetota bacterium]|nr:ABC transporter permease [Actinomycetota bacterium]
MLTPVVLIVIVSFSGAGYFDFPPDSWGLRQYREAFGDPRWWSAVAFSLELAAPVALMSAVVAVPAAFAIRRSRLPGRHIAYAGGLAGILIPISAFSVALYGVMSQLGLRGTYVGLVLAHTILAVPIMLIVVTAALGRIPVELELAAMTSGASRARAWLGITVRLLIPAIFAGGVLAFVTSFDEAVLINFLGGPDQTTLPKAILDSARFGVSPVITAVATLLMVATSAVAIAAVWLAGRRS